MFNILSLMMLGLLSLNMCAYSDDTRTLGDAIIEETPVDTAKQGEEAAFELLNNIDSYLKEEDTNVAHDVQSVLDYLENTSKENSEVQELQNKASTHIHDIAVKYRGENESGDGRVDPNEVIGEDMMMLQETLLQVVKENGKCGKYGEKFQFIRKNDRLGRIMSVTPANRDCLFGK